MRVADTLSKALELGEDGLREAVACVVDELDTFVSTERGEQSNEVLGVDVMLERNPEWFFVTSLASAANSGKSTLMCELALRLMDAGRIDEIVVFSISSATAKKDYGCLPNALFYDYSEETLKAVIDNCRARVSAGRPVKRRLVILDDVMGTGADKSNAVMELFTSGRHCGLMPVLISQMSNRVMTPTVKNQSRYILFSELTGGGLKALHSDFIIRPRMKPQQFVDWADEHLVKHTFALYDRDERSLSLVRADPDWLTLRLSGARGEEKASV